MLIKDSMNVDCAKGVKQLATLLTSCFFFFFVTVWMGLNARVLGTILGFKSFGLPSVCTIGFPSFIQMDGSSLL